MDQKIDNQTQSKISDPCQWQLLLVDGHNSHYMCSFIEFACEKKIHVLCYPLHSAHIYQGLDVVVFGVLKCTWSSVHDQYESKTRQKVSKENFLKLYAQAHWQALLTSKIISAFKKTGIVPFNPHVITTAMMAPNLGTSVSGNLFLLPINEPALFLTEMIHSEIKKQKQAHTITNRNNSDTSPPLNIQWCISQASPAPDEPTVKAAVDSLTSTSLSYLLNSSPIYSDKAPPEC